MTERTFADGGTFADLSDTAHCAHELNFDHLVAIQQSDAITVPGAPQKMTLAAECAKCHGLVSLDTILSLIMKRIFDLEHRLGPVSRLMEEYVDGGRGEA